MEMGIRSDNTEKVGVVNPKTPITSSELNIDNASNEVNQTYHYTSRNIYLWNQLFASFVICIGSLAMGNVFGYLTTALPSIMKSSMNITIRDVHYVNGFLPLASLGGCLIGCPLIEFVGRRWTILGIAVPLFIGWMLVATAKNLYMVCVGRIFCGFCIGVLSLAFPIYLAESIQTRIRGTLGMLPKVFERIGILLSVYIGDRLDWSKSAFVGCALPILFFGLMFLIPETPRWYVTKGRYNEARRVLQWFRGLNNNIEKEIQEIIQSQTESNKIGGRACCNLFSMEYIHIVAILIGLHIFQQLCGYNIILIHTSLAFATAGVSFVSELTPVYIMGWVSLASILFTVGLIDRLGRKMLLYISCVFMLVALFTMSLYFYFQGLEIEESNRLKWVPLISVVIHLSGYFIGLGSMPRFMLAEIIPSKIRGTAACLDDIFYWTYVAYLYPKSRNIVESFELHGALWFYVIMCFFAILFVRFFVPETLGKSLEQIEQEMTYDTRRLRLINENQN